MATFIIRSFVVIAVVAAFLFGALPAGAAPASAQTPVAVVNIHACVKTGPSDNSSTCEISWRGANNQLQVRKIVIGVVPASLPAGASTAKGITANVWSWPVRGLVSYTAGSISMAAPGQQPKNYNFD